MDEIGTVQTRVHSGGVAALVQDYIAARRPDAAPPAALADVQVTAYVNHGRWVADCPFCNGAELIDLDDPRFYCLSCLNATVGGAWLAVKLPAPAERAAIEHELLRRKEDRHRNWLPGETVTRLHQERRNFTGEVD